MERTEKFQKLNWFDFMVLKALVLAPTHSLSTSEIGLKLSFLYDLYGIKCNTTTRRVYFINRVKNLIDLGLVEKTRGAISIYSLNQKCVSDVMLLVSGFFGLMDRS